MNKRDSSHVAAQRAARQRDNNTCMICGSHNHVAGHHTLDYQYGGSASLSNIVTLCRGCHTKAHNGKMDVFSL